MLVLATSISIAFLWYFISTKLDKKYSKIRSDYWDTIPSKIRETINLKLPPIRDKNNIAVKIILESKRLDLNRFDISTILNVKPVEYYLKIMEVREISESDINALKKNGFLL